MKLSDEKYESVFCSLENATKGILHSFAFADLDIKEILIRNFIAKSFSLLNSINLLQRTKQYGESVILYRVLVERFLYLKFIIDNKSYKEFDDWSFVKDFERRNNVRSYLEFNDNVRKGFLKDKKSHIDRYQKLKVEKTNWIEPDLESYSKKIDLGFLYKLSYDFGSSFVHPRASEGHFDVIRLTGLQNENDWIFKPIIHNALLLHIVIIKTGLLALSSDNYHLMYIYCDKLLSYISDGVHISDLNALTKISIMGLIKE